MTEKNKVTAKNRLTTINNETSKNNVTSKNKATTMNDETTKNQATSMNNVTSKNKVTKKNRKWRLVIWAMLIVLFVIAADVRLKTVYYELSTDKIDTNVRIALITDLHSCKYGKNEKKLIDAVKKENPDVVLLGGDIFDDGLPYDNAIAFLKAMAAEYPCYYVSGNHEYWTEEIDVVKQIVRDMGITVLEGECEALTIGEERINICGIDDPTRMSNLSLKNQMKTALDEAEKGRFTVLLSHRPELFEEYCTYGFDLVLSGHAHGGQWRIPGLINGLYVPNQGWFPKYAGGRYDSGDTTMIVSRGLARESTKAPRFFNRPELVIVDVVP